MPATPLQFDLAAWPKRFPSMANEHDVAQSLAQLDAMGLVEWRLRPSDFRIEWLEPRRAAEHVVVDRSRKNVLEHSLEDLSGYVHGLDCRASIIDLHFSGHGRVTRVANATHARQIEKECARHSRRACQRAAAGVELCKNCAQVTGSWQDKSFNIGSKQESSRPIQPC